MDRLLGGLPEHHGLCIPEALGCVVVQGGDPCGCANLVWSNNQAGFLKFGPSGADE